MPIPAILSAAASVTGAVASVNNTVGYWDNLFTTWLPQLSLSHTVTVQGSPLVSPRTTLHLALATVFGLANTNEGDRFTIEAEVDQRNNTATVTYAVQCSTMMSIIRGLLLNTKKGKPTTTPTPSKKRDWWDESLFDAAFNNAVDSIAVPLIPVVGNIAVTAADEDDALAAVQGGEKAAAPKVPGGEFRVPDGEDLENPPIVPKQNATDIKRGLNGEVITEDIVRAPWLVAREGDVNPVNPLGQRELFQDIEQMANFGIRDGPTLLYNLAKDRVFSGATPWQMPKDRQIQPFTDIQRFHQRDPNKPAMSKPIITREPDINPQFQQALGVDVRTLVAQMLYDPGTRPPLPETDKGPPTKVDD